MPGIVFSEASNVANSIYGNCQAPIKMLVESYGEECERKSMLPHLFKMESSTNFAEMFTEMTGMDGFDPVGENGAYPEDNMQEGDSKLIVSETWKDSFSISQEMVEDAKILDMKKQPRAFIRAYNRTREKYGAAMFAGAICGMKSVPYRGKSFDISCADGKPLFSTAHPAKGKGKAQSNAFSNDFSLEVLDMAETAMHLFEDHNGEILEVAPKTILIPEYAKLKREVFGAVGSDMDPESANNAFNFQYGRWNVIMWPYLNHFLKKHLAAGKRPWIMMDDEFNQEYGGAIWIDRIKLAVRSVIDESNDANKWKGRSRFKAGFNNWRFACCGGMADGTDLTTLDL